MQHFLPHYLTFDLDINTVEKYDMKLLFGLWVYHFKFYDFKYEEPKLDFVDLKVKL